MLCCRPQTNNYQTNSKIQKKRGNFQFHTLVVGGRVCIHHVLLYHEDSAKEEKVAKY